MKKILYTTALMLMTAMVFTSCVGGQVSKKERKEQQESEQEAFPSTVIYTIRCSQDVVDAIDLVVKYKDKGGINATDTIRDTLWTKAVVHDSIPVKVGLDWSLSPKPASKITKETFDELYATYDIQIKPDRRIDANAIMRYLNFPASKLSDLCDLENYRQTVARTHHDFHFPCYVYGRNRQDYPGLDPWDDYEEADWDD